MKNNLSIILSIIAIVGVVSVWILWGCNVIELSVISLDSFVGIIVSLLGILVTFAIGWQIINAIEIKAKLKEIEAIKYNVEEQREQLNQFAAGTKHETMFILGQDYYRKGDFANAFRCVLISLQHCLLLKEANNISLVLHLLENLAGNMQMKGTISISDNQEILNTDKIIRSSSKFVFIQDRYEELFRTYLKNRRVIDNKNNN